MHMSLVYIHNTLTSHAALVSLSYIMVLFLIGLSLWVVHALLLLLRDRGILTHIHVTVSLMYMSVSCRSFLNVYRKNNKRDNTSLSAITTAKLYVDLMSETRKKY